MPPHIGKLVDGLSEDNEVNKNSPKEVKQQKGHSDGGISL